MAEQSRQGQFLQADFFDNTGGVNLTDSPFRMLDSQASGGTNYEYALTGGIRKRNGHSKLNSSANAALKTLGADIYLSASGTKTAIRAAGTRIQSYNLTTTFTNLTEDTVSAGSTFLDSASTQPFVTQFFKTTSADVLWGTGAGAAAGKIFGVYSSTKVTQNGSSPATGAISLSAGSTGGTIPTGTYYYAISLRKASTLAESNAGLDQSVSVTLGQKVTIDLTGLTSLDTTKYDKIIVYRSSAGGVSGFTAGVQVATINSTETSYLDTGTSEDSSAPVPRADSTVLDNSILPTGKTYKTIAAFKRHLVTASESTIYYSDLNKPESWPTANVVTIPSGGPITALATLSFTTPTSLDLDEVLVIFKEREMWAITTSINNDGDEVVKLTFVDVVGCANQPTVVSANGYIAWFDYRGFYLWDGSGKPIYMSRPLETLFSIDGDIDKTKINLAWGKFFRRNNHIVWCLSHKVYGEQKYYIKMDLRLTIPSIQTNLGGRVIDGVFIQDQAPFSLYAGTTFLPSDYEEMFLAGDGSGYMYSLFSDSQNDGDEGVDFSYETKFLDLGSKSTTKRFHKIIIWTKDSTDANLTMDWWVTYRSDEDSKATLARPASNSVIESRWDLGYWDIAYWDSSVAAFNPVVYNLSTPVGGIEGDCIKLRFRQDETNAPITIAGFTVIYSMLGLRK